MAVAGARRGRRPELPRDDTPVGELYGDVAARIGWLLRVHRLQHQDIDVQQGARFVRRLRLHGVAADQSRISRWESARVPVPAEVLTGYEQVLGLDGGTLTSVALGLQRSLTRGGEVAAVTAPEFTDDGIDRLNSAFDRVIGGKPVGADWSELAQGCAAGPRLVFLRDSDWEAISHQLVREMTLGVSTAYVTRFEALRGLMVHPRARGHLLRAIGALITEPDTQVVIDAISLLQEVDVPRAGDTAMRLLHTGSGQVRTGAATTLAGKLARGHLSELQQRALARILADILHQDLEAHNDPAIADVVARMDRGPQMSLLRLVSPSVDSLLLRVSRAGELSPAAVAEQISVEVARATGAAHADRDGMLARLVREAMFHGHEERRHHASVLLMSSPYRAALAAVLADRVTAREAEHGRAMILLSYLAGSSERAQLAAVASDATHGGAVRSSALHGLGHVGVEAYADAALTAVDDPQPSVARAALYALGMSGGPEIFELSTASPHSGSVSDDVRRAATWWQRVGPAVRDCAG